jgi:hypothetical protein
MRIRGGVTDVSVATPLYSQSHFTSAHLSGAADGRDGEPSEPLTGRPPLKATVAGGDPRGRVGPRAVRRGLSTVGHARSVSGGGRLQADGTYIAARMFRSLLRSVTGHSIVKRNRSLIEQCGGGSQAKVRLVSSTCMRGAWSSNGKSSGVTAVGNNGPDFEFARRLKAW